jgi:CheY-like chemotaxis protein
LARKILLADDSVTAQNMGRKILADAGYEVIAVNNGSAALKKIAELKPDLAILDVYMPGYSGLEVCQRLKESQDSNHIPVLLTVGKLEPFKPEEAQRVRAEGYIVKPFEASELLSALSKLEDKVVPRAEPSKPGRFARAIAAVEESSRGDAATKENGWKSRIGFPQKKTEAEEKVAANKVADDSLIYNALNRDLRTVVETAAEKTAEMKQQLSGDDEEPGVDVAALVPSSLPNDVTPEEVAAIAAAVAKMQMAAAAALEHDQVAEAERPAELNPVSDRVEANPPKAESGDVASLHAPAETAICEPGVPGLGLSQNGHERIDQEGSGQEKSERDEARDLPVTMAATAESVAAASEGASRWTAVAVALDTEERGLSLEQEMQKAYAAAVPYLAVAATTAAEELSPVAQSSASAESAVQAQVAEISNPIPEPAPAPEASTAPEPVVTAAPAEAESLPVVQAEATASTSSFPTETASIEEPSVTATRQPETAAITSGPDAAEATAEKAADFTDATQAPVDAFESPAFASAIATGSILPEPSCTDSPSANASTQAQTFDAYAESQSAPATESAEVKASGAYAPLARVLVQEAEQTQEPKLDTETVKTTAAAWASWRQIRDTSSRDTSTRDTSKGPDAAQADPTESQSTEFAASESTPQEAVAAAAAAGAEHVLIAAPDTSHNSSEVASIVDSVLADLRPKLMEEISRKMAQKK